MDAGSKLNTILPHGRTSALSAALVFLFTLPPAAMAEEATTPFLQIYLGVAELDDQTARWTDTDNESVDVDFSSLPTAGF